MDGTASAAAADILARLERVPVGRWHLRTRAVLGVALFFDAFDLLAISFALPAFVNEWHLTPSLVGWVLSAAFMGQFVGAIAAGWLADRYGRLVVIASATALFSVMSLACAFAWGPAPLIAFRFLEGVGLGAEVPISNTYVNELARSDVRGRFYILFQMMFAFGLIAAGFAGYVIVPRFGWQTMFYIGTLPLVMSALIPVLCPESPRWLVATGRLGAADAAVTLIERAIAAEGKTLPPPQRRTAPVAAPAAGDGPSWREIFAARFRGRTFAVWVLWYCCFSTTYGLQAWLPTLYRAHFHLGVAQANFYGFITQCCGIFGSLICAFTVDRTGRRPWFIAAFAGGAVTLLALAAVGPRTAQLLLAFVSVGGFFMSTAAISLNLYTSELYPTRIRAFGGAVGGAWQRVAAAIGPLVVGYLVPLYGLGPVFLYFGGLALAGAVVTYACAIETRGLVLEDLSG